MLFSLPLHQLSLFFKKKKRREKAAGKDEGEGKADEKFGDVRTFLGEFLIPRGM